MNPERRDVEAPLQERFRVEDEGNSFSESAEDFLQAPKMIKMAMAENYRFNFA